MNQHSHLLEAAVKESGDVQNWSSGPVERSFRRQTSGQQRLLIIRKALWYKTRPGRVLYHNAFRVRFKTIRIQV